MNNEGLVDAKRAILRNDGAQTATSVSSASSAVTIDSGDGYQELWDLLLPQLLQ